MHLTSYFLVNGVKVGPLVLMSLGKQTCFQNVPTQPSKFPHFKWWNLARTTNESNCLCSTEAEIIPCFAAHPVIRGQIVSRLCKKNRQTNEITDKLCMRVCVCKIRKIKQNPALDNQRTQLKGAFRGKKQVVPLELTFCRWLWPISGATPTRSPSLRNHPLCQVCVWGMDFENLDR